MARRRYGASKYFYLSSIEDLASDKGRKRNAFLTAACFGRDPKPGAELKLDDRCWAYTWMAYHGGVDDMRALGTSVEHFIDVEAYNPVTMAARSEHIGTLTATVECRHKSSVEYLCVDDNIQRLTEDQVIHACGTAVTNGCVHVLR
ncbi:uncharacterized protein FPRO_14874 [Fusarium proliferatum ET1]|uniref:Uncharacterized protein n=1 Tax=Fusarium proliferatum (strain ET1) TaxID=1227346 RepID=A0A1L7WAP0_FUSPR|nr:uncharacterized protein FPRO_14874 [Fusarium proliferatum ET1]CZR49647.1 uncharacterized protein FPRO_14874 [Fusarium proliferatum ET1]